MRSTALLLCLFALGTTAAPAYAPSNPQPGPATQVPAATPSPAATPAPAATPGPAATPSTATTPSALDDAGVTLQPPTGWTKRDFSMNLGSMKLVAMWVPAGTTNGENIDLGTEPAPGFTLSDYVARSMTMIQKLGGSNAVVASHAEKICGGEQDGWFIQSHMTFGAQSIVTESVLTTKASNGYVAAYSRLQGLPENPAARAALDSLCATVSNPA